MNSGCKYLLFWKHSGLAPAWKQKNQLTELHIIDSSSFKLKQSIMGMEKLFFHIEGYFYRMELINSSQVKPETYRQSPKYTNVL